MKQGTTTIRTKVEAMRKLGMVLLRIGPNLVLTSSFGSAA
jgi:hypothetical protein